MPKVPQYNLKPLKSVYQAGEGYVSMKQRNLIITLCERRKIAVPDFKDMTKRKAMSLIDSMLNPR